MLEKGKLLNKSFFRLDPYYSQDVRVAFTSKAAEALCKGMFARLTHNNVSKETVQHAQDRGWKWARSAILESSLQPANLRALLLNTFSGNLDDGLQQLGITEAEIELSVGDRMRIGEEEHQVALEYVNEHNKELRNVDEMRQFLRNAKGDVHNGLKSMGGLSDTETEDESQSENEQQSEDEHSVIDLCSQDTEASISSENQVRDPKPAPDIAVKTDEPEPESAEAVKAQIIKFFGPECALFDQAIVGQEVRKHGTFSATGGCLLRGGCVKPKEKPERLVTPDQNPKKREAMMRGFYAANKHTFAAGKRAGHQRAMAGTSDMWDKNDEEEAVARKGKNGSFFGDDTHRMYKGKPSQRPPDHMIGKGVICGKGTVESNMSKHHRSPGTSKSGKAAHKPIPAFNPDDVDLETVVLQI